MIRAFRTWTLLSAAWLAVVLPRKAPALECSVDRQELSGGQEEEVFVFSLHLDEPGDVAAKVYDAQGNFVRLLVEKYSTETDLQVPWNMKDQWGERVKPGVYTVKVRTGFKLTLDEGFADGGVMSGPPLLSPWLVKTDAKGDVYLLDGGTAILYKFRPDGSPAKDFAGSNRIEAPNAPWWGSFALDEEGRIYLPLTHTTSHVIQVHDPKTAAVLYNIGGFFGNDPGWETENRGGIAYPAWVGTNPGHRLYASSPRYYVLAAWDSRKPGKQGAQWLICRKVESRANWGVPGDAGDTDGHNAIYLNWPGYTQWHGFSKVLDLGNEARGAYSIQRYTDPATGQTVELKGVRGIAYDGAGGVFVVLRQQGRVLKFSDTGFGFDYVTAFGEPGKDASKLQFTAPRSVAVSPDGSALYVAEDGDPISGQNTTPGLARLMKFKVGYAAEKQLQVTVKP